MAQLRGGNDTAIRMDQIEVGDLFDGTITAQSSTSLTVDLGDGYIDSLSGTGFAFTGDGVPTAGTIHSIKQTINGSTSFDINGLQTSATTFYATAASADTGAAYTLLFSGHDNMHGTPLDDFLRGFGGNDNVFGGGGADTLYGGAGNDHVFGFSGSGGDDGADLLFGDEGNDYLQGNAGADSIDGGDGSDRINGGADGDVILGAAGNDSINGNRGGDDIDGGAGNDLLRGGQGDDLVAGGEGSDTIAGDLGADTLEGGAGIDFFIFAPASALHAGSRADMISDFEDGVDHIQIGFAPAAVLTGAAQADFNAAAITAQQLFDANAGSGEVAALMVGSDTYLFYSGDNGGAANSAILLTGVDASLIGTADF